MNKVQPSESTPKRHKVIRHIPKAIILTVMGVLLFVTGILGCIYSPWFQDAIATRLVERLNADPNTTVRLGSLRLKFPLHLHIDDALYVSHNDTVVKAGNVDVKVGLMPLLTGEVALKHAVLTDARYKLGNTDSATCMVIDAKYAHIGASQIRLSDMDIHLGTVDLDSVGVSLYINPADTFPETPASEPSPMTISVDRVNYKNLGFNMVSMPTIYNLDTRIATGYIDSVKVDIMKQTVDVANVQGQRLSALYLMPDSAQIAATTVIVNENKTPSAPWTVNVDKLDMTESQALYTTYGIEPLPGLDFSYIQVSDINLSVHDFYNQATEIRLPFNVAGRERCGIDLEASGTLAIDSVGMSFNNFHLNTPSGTILNATGYMGTFAELTNPAIPLSLKTDGDIAVKDLKTMFPSFSPYFVGMRTNAMINLKADVNGTSGNLDIADIDVKIDRHIKLDAHGSIKNIFEEKGMSGNVTFSAVVTDVSNWTADLLAGTGVMIPSLSVGGSLRFDNNNYSGNLTGKTQGGTIALKGAFNGYGDKYGLDLVTNRMPISAFMPSLGIGRVTASVKADGIGFDFFSPKTVADVKIDIKSLEYLERTYNDVVLDANVGNDEANIEVDSYNSGLDFHLHAKGNIDNGHYLWKVNLDSDELDLADLGFSETPATVSANLTLRADIAQNMKDISASLTVNSAEYNTPDNQIAIDDSKLVLETTDSVTNLMARNRDLMAFFSSSLPLDSIIDRVGRISEVVDSQMVKHIIDIPQLQETIIPFQLNIEGGSNNALAEMLAVNNMGFDHLSILAANDTCLYLTANVEKFKTGEVTLDAISFDIRQLGNRLNYDAQVNNRPGTFDDWAHVDVKGYFAENKLGINIYQQNIKKQTGFDLGATLSLNPDTTMTMHFEPYDPIINYQKWHINNDNFVSFDFKHHHLDADLRMKSDVSRLALYTEHATDALAENHNDDEDLVLQLFDIKLQDWIALDPFAPPLKGNLSAGIRLNWKDNFLNGEGTVDLTDFMYGKEKVGDFNVDLNVATDIKGLVKADADVWVNGKEAIRLAGTLNDTTQTSPFNLDLRMINFPLAVANPFIPDIAKLSGALNGQLDIKGDTEHPELNGYLAFDDAQINVLMLGSTLTLTHDSIPVINNLITFDNFTIKAVNENPLSINGTVNISSLTSPKINLTLNADNMQLVNTNRARKGADIYGKAFVSLNSTVKGNLDVINVNATVDVMPGTNITYVLTSGAAAIESQAAGNMVKFVNFADTAAVAAADSIKIEGTILNLNANLNIRTGAIINVDLGTNAQDKVQIQGSGNFNYVSSVVGDGRLTGRYTFSGGFIKYAPPLISNINFAFTEGSYVSFQGDILNPQFNIKAVEQMRANVSQAGQNSRLIYFDIILNVTGSLSNPKLSFNLETDDDVTVANELASMSPTQRESEAMNLLIYNTYTGGSTKATSNLNGNPLFSFLTNSVNSWLANNVRGVDLSIGVDQYDQTTNGATSTTTSYSYRVSKSLFNDRFKIIVGGSYSNDAADEGSVAENLINDISFEYFLNDSRTMYLKLFRHTGFVSILEGEVTQTGVGFVYKKRIARLSDMFIPSRYRRHKNQATRKTEQEKTEPEQIAQEQTESTGEATNTSQTEPSEKEGISTNANSLTTEP
ncbi:MAG: translocation/assembly module TamB domain-containing protein [Muribaculaceae bacterium]|nr:translocation/assembly module TamB domain-containing protein [Muribaculaceae bacterium]